MSACCTGKWARGKLARGARAAPTRARRSRSARAEKGSPSLRDGNSGGEVIRNPAPEEGGSPPQKAQPGGRVGDMPPTGRSGMLKDPPPQHHRFIPDSERVQPPHGSAVAARATRPDSCHPIVTTAQETSQRSGHGGSRFEQQRIGHRRGAKAFVPGAARLATSAGAGRPRRARPRVLKRHFEPLPESNDVRVAFVHERGFNADASRGRQGGRQHAVVRVKKLAPAVGATLIIRHAELRLIRRLAQPGDDPFRSASRGELNSHGEHRGKDAQRAARSARLGVRLPAGLAARTTVTLSFAFRPVDLGGPREAHASGLRPSSAQTVKSGKSAPHGFRADADAEESGGNASESARADSGGHRGLETPVAEYDDARHVLTPAALSMADRRRRIRPPDRRILNRQ